VSSLANLWRATLIHSQYTVHYCKRRLGFYLQRSLPQDNKIARSIFRSAMGLLAFLLIAKAMADPYTEGEFAFNSRDYATALHKFHIAAESGDADAAVRLGTMYFLGLGVPKNDSQAIRWYRVAAVREHVDAQFSLATILYGSSQYGEALRWFKALANRGFTQAYSHVGEMYEHGRGTLQDYREAIVWYSKGAKTGEPASQESIGRMYATGRGVQQDFVRAHMWLNIAASGGSKTSAEGREIVSRRMTLQQLDQAQQMAKLCLESGYKKCE
jgi:TPR repeat protein